MAVAVADRLRLEAEEELLTLRQTQQDTEQQLAAALHKRQETAGELESLRAQHEETCQKLSTMALSHRQAREELETVRAEHKETCQKLSALTATHQQAADELRALRDREVTRAGKGQVSETQTESEDKRGVSEDVRKAEGPQRGGVKGVAKRYLQSVAAEEKRREEGYSGRDPRKIVMLSERSR